jgi:predicted DNA-binding transcriptional regulator YafY
MNLIKNLNQVEKLHELIVQQKTGTSKELAEKLGISRAKLYVLIDELTELNMPVAYSRKYETFYYVQEKPLTFSAGVSMN